MTRRTRKAGVSGRYGPRYGVRVRKQISTVSRAKSQSYECPRCHRMAVRRVSTGIWQCRKCELKFAGGAYSPHISSRGQMAQRGEAEELAAEAGEPDSEEET